MSTTMPKRRLAAGCLIMLAAATRAEPPAKPPATQPAEAAWSEPSNGLRARLSMKRTSVVNGTGIITTYLELDNVRNLGNPMVVKVPALKFTVTDADGKDVPVSGGPFDGMSFDTPDLVLPHDSSLRFRIGPCGFGIPGDRAALLDLGPGDGWEFPRDGKSYYLQAVMQVAEAKGDRTDHAVPWHGRLVLPRVRIPTEADPVDPATVGPRIEDLGGKMLVKDGDVSELAARELSLIDDPRVIPWYVTAMQTNSRSLKMNALDRLSRFEGDAALDGIKIGITTRGKDIGNTTTPALAQSSADAIRHSTALALARSPHPKAKAVLWTMKDDPYYAVRLTVIQTAARLDAPESLELLQHATQDANETVRGEALRLLKERESKPK